MADDAAREQLRAFLMRGPASARDATRQLRLSQSAFSRLVQRLGGEILAFGKARATRYVAAREIEGVGRSIPVYEIEEPGTARQLGTLRAALPQAFLFEALHPDATAAG